MTVTFEYNPETGAPILKTSTGRRSDPCGYQGIAQLEIGDTRYVAFGDYFIGYGFIQPGVVYRLVAP